MEQFDIYLMDSLRWLHHLLHRCHLGGMLEAKFEKLNIIYQFDDGFDRE